MKIRVRLTFDFLIEGETYREPDEVEETFYLTLPSEIEDLLRDLGWEIIRKDASVEASEH